MSIKNEEIDWSEELAVAVKIVGKSILKFVGWIFNIIMTVGLICVITGTIVGCAFLIYVNNYLDTSIDDFTVMASDKNMTTVLSYIDENGKTVEIPSERLSASENRVWVKYSEMNEYIRNAFIAIEDKRFETHKGVDWISMLGLAKNALLHGEIRGGSTITMQLIKNVTGNDEVTIQRKAAEIFKALNLEKKYDKTEILEMYLNNIYLSEGCYGVGAAAYTYFSKEVKDLTLIEAAAIAGITQNPYLYDPILNPESNAAKRNTVLQYMYDQGKITKEEFESVYEKELELHIPGEDDEDSSFAIHSWYTDAAQQEAVRLLQEQYGYTASFAEKVLLTGGYNIVTAQDPKIQKILEDYYTDASNWEKHDSSPIQPESACVVIDPENGNVVGLVGGRGKKNINLGLNYATQTKRPPGSSIKPLSVYGPALEYGVITYATVVDDVPVDFGTKKINPDTGEVTYGSKHGNPKNSPDRYRGLTTVHEGVRASINTVAWRTLELLGLENSFDFVTKKVGLSTLVYSEKLSNGAVFSDVAYAPLALGQLTWGATVKEMTAAYQIFANGGIFNEERIVLQILDSNGEVVVDNAKKSSIVMSAQNASIMTRMLKAVVDSGTASYAIPKSLKGTVSCAGKTGTTETNHDRWFVGYTPYYVCGIWMGYSMPRALSKFNATKPMTAVAWGEIMASILKDKIEDAQNGGEPLKKFEDAAGIVTAQYCKDSGKLMTDACKADPRGDRSEIGYFVSGTEPTEYCDVHTFVDYDKKTKSIAAPGCSASDIIKVGLLNVFRQFPFDILVEDASYTMQELPVDYSYEGLTATMPYYANMLPKGFYSGHSEKLYNHICVSHIESIIPEPIEPVDDVPQ